MQCTGIITLTKITIKRLSVVVGSSNTGQMQYIHFARSFDVVMFDTNYLYILGVEYFGDLWSIQSHEVGGVYIDGLIATFAFNKSTYTSETQSTTVKGIKLL